MKPRSAILAWLLLAASAQAVTYRTENFVVTAQTSELAKEVGDAAERFRVEMAELWLGKEMPAWSTPCPITVRVSPTLGAGGMSNFTFENGEVYGWSMSVQGSRERVLDSVLPHEVTHTVFASHFRDKLPRWADEGACTVVEHQSEVVKQEQRVIDYLKTKRGIAFDQMFAMTEYPQDAGPLYAQGHSVACWLIEKHGHRHFVHSLEHGMKDGNWPAAFGYSTAIEMQTDWLAWVKAGRPTIQTVAYQPCIPCQGIIIRSPIAIVPRYPANQVIQQPARQQPTYAVNPASGLTPPRAEQNPAPPLDKPQPQPPNTTIDQELQQIRDNISGLTTISGDQIDINDTTRGMLLSITNRLTVIEQHLQSAAPAHPYPAFFIRVADPRGAAYSTDFQKVQLGPEPKYITLPFQPVSKPAQ